MNPISDARTCKDGCTYLQGRLHVLAGKVASTSVENAVHCKDGCSALQRRLQCTASEMGITEEPILRRTALQAEASWCAIYTEGVAPGYS